MDTICFFINHITLTWNRLRRRLPLLAGLSLLCFLLPLGMGEAARQMLSRGVNFSGITLAVSAPQGDETPGLLETYMGGMEDIAQYCRFAAMEEDDALKALKAGEVTAVLRLPEGFIQGVMKGENPDLQLIVSGNHPLESLLLLWVGQSAADILSAFQGGIYAVLELYAQNPPPGLGQDQVIAEINLRYLTLALDRSSFFSSQKISATGTLPISTHYGLSLLAYLALSAAPFFTPLYMGDWLIFQRRLRCAGRDLSGGLFSAVTAGAGTELLLLLPFLISMKDGNPFSLALTGMLAAVFCSLAAALCCLAAESDSGCAVLAFSVSLLSLFLSGGIVPPVLLPGWVRRLSAFSPVTWLRQLMAWPMGYDVPTFTWAALALSAAGMTILSLILYRRRAEGVRP